MDYARFAGNLDNTGIVKSTFFLVAFSISRYRDKVNGFEQELAILLKYIAVLHLKIVVPNDNHS